MNGRGGKLAYAFCINFFRFQMISAENISRKMGGNMFQSTILRTALLFQTRTIIFGYCLAIWSSTSNFFFENIFFSIPLGLYNQIQSLLMLAALIASIFCVNCTMSSQIRFLLMTADLIILLGFGILFLRTPWSLVVSKVLQGLGIGANFILEGRFKENMTSVIPQKHLSSILNIQEAFGIGIGLCLGGIACDYQYYSGIIMVLPGILIIFRVLYFLFSDEMKKFKLRPLYDDSVKEISPNNFTDTSPPKSLKEDQNSSKTWRFKKDNWLLILLSFSGQSFLISSFKVIYCSQFTSHDKELVCIFLGISCILSSIIALFLLFRIKNVSIRILYFIAGTVIFSLSIVGSMIIISLTMAVVFQILSHSMIFGSIKQDRILKHNIRSGNSQLILYFCSNLIVLMVGTAVSYELFSWIFLVFSGIIHFIICIFWPHLSETIVVNPSIIIFQPEIERKSQIIDNSVNLNIKKIDQNINGREKKKFQTWSEDFRMSHHGLHIDMPLEMKSSNMEAILQRDLVRNKPNFSLRNSVHSYSVCGNWSPERKQQTINDNNQASSYDSSKICTLLIIYSYIYESFFQERHTKFNSRSPIKYS